MFSSTLKPSQFFVLMLTSILFGSLGLGNRTPNNDNPNHSAPYSYNVNNIFLRNTGSRSVSENQYLLNDFDVNTPYLHHHGPLHGNRFIRDCQHVKYGNLTHSLHLPQGGLEREMTLPLTETKHTIKELGPIYNKRQARGHVTYVNNPFYTVSVLEPLHPGTCKNDSGVRATVEESARQKNCLVAINAGFFNTKNGACLGNLVSDGKLVLNSEGVQNAHFGILKNGSLFFGYLDEETLLTSDFVELVGGVIWLVRDGEPYIKESIEMECEDTEETGTLQLFADVESARTAVGVDENGRIIIVQIDGRTHQNGMTLWELSEFLIELGAVNAINFDGGGSATYIINGTLSNYPTDICPDNKNFNCERNVSTILCVHLPGCTPTDCNNHGECILGKCECFQYWSGDACDKLNCPQHCNNNGQCTEDGCLCKKGWVGNSCNISCPVGTYGLNCSERCGCENGASCNTSDGSCKCPPGYTGKLCDRLCAYGYFGDDCQAECYCPDDCTCDPITGSCHYSINHTDIFKAGYCLMKQMILEKHLVVDQPEQYRLCLTSIILVSVIAVISIIINISLICAQCVWKKTRRRLRRKVGRTYGKESANDDSANEGDGENSTDSESSAEEETSFITQPHKSSSKFSTPSINIP